MKNSERLAMPRARAVAAVLALAAFTGALPGYAQDRPVPDSFEAMTTGMEPDGLMLKVDILNWTDADAAADVIAALTSDDVASALADLPSLGVVWRSGSAVGHSVKYARRETTDQGQRITIVTDKPLDAYSFKPWSVAGQPAPDPLPYSVIELDIDGSGHGVGNLSLAADVEIDADAGSISLASGGQTVLADARALPKPYWASSGG